MTRLRANRMIRAGCHLLLCAAYLQGGIVKAWDFAAARAEMAHFGLVPGGAFAAAVIALELLAPAAIVLGVGRWIAALLLAAFTLAATFLANRFWSLAPGTRDPAMNGFFEHLGLVGGFLLVAWEDLCRKRIEAGPGSHATAKAPRTPKRSGP